MNINGSTLSGMQEYASMQKPSKPSEPTAPAGGNVENRQPPKEPEAPSKSEGAKALGVGNMLDVQG